MKKEKVLLLFSGGYDSTVLLHLALKLGYEPFCLIIDYGQVHREEITFARHACDILGENNDLMHMVQKIDLLVAAKLTQKEGEVQYDGVSEWHVPSRNLTFISLAAGVAESHGITKIWYGANYEDREHLFPDCYQEWVYKVNQLLEIKKDHKKGFQIWP